jgi:hypothetical protein
MVQGIEYRLRYCLVKVNTTWGGVNIVPGVETVITSWSEASAEMSFRPPYQGALTEIVG